MKAREAGSLAAAEAARERTAADLAARIARGEAGSWDVEAAAASLDEARTARLLDIARAKQAESERRDADVAEVAKILGGDGALGPDTPDRQHNTDAYFDRE